MRKKHKALYLQPTWKCIFYFHFFLRLTTIKQTSSTFLKNYYFFCFYSIIHQVQVFAFLKCKVLFPSTKLQSRNHLSSGVTFWQTSFGKTLADGTQHFWFVKSQYLWWQSFISNELEPPCIDLFLEWWLLFDCTDLQRATVTFKVVRWFRAHKKVLLPFKICLTFKTSSKHRLFSGTILVVLFSHICVEKQKTVST